MEVGRLDHPELVTVVDLALGVLGEVGEAAAVASVEHRELVRRQRAGEEGDVAAFQSGARP
ncbi:hypothetical protein [Chenggangzhangella methanolivorans]|uniref:Uncharacterized protein n=1 Tax=Chenggangzhangella methanolivorans TaxID=1437009 RepID=A0A9E6R9N7_9HYPH|nr:hypothetical protein [Chenggangzhangella methanolivorans]QZO00689.1 hypothetical protein K6K41_02995 [Chenggangzhangella methanolivorans]